MQKTSTGLINANEAYSKAEVLSRLGVSQKFWDKMLDDGMPFTRVGKSRWVIGRDLIEYLQDRSEKKCSDQQ
ncbi:MAG: topoisomerase II [Planctomycetes bacterium]|nr:topoisomerase II [Planctomycetota bacterium]